MRSMETAGCTVHLSNGMGFKGRRQLWMRKMGVNKSQEVELGRHTKGQCSNELSRRVHWRQDSE